jgi:hypothetical protein
MSSGSYRQSIPELGLSIEKETAAVPSDGKYYVLKDEETVGCFRSLKQAQGLFKKIVQESGYKPIVTEGGGKGGRGGV